MELLVRRALIPIALIITWPIQAHSQASRRYSVIGPVRSFRQEMTRLTEIEGKEVEGPRVLIQVLTFDDDGHPADQIMNRPDGSLKWKNSWRSKSREVDGQEIERSFFDANGVVSSVATFSYDG